MEEKRKEEYCVPVIEEIDIEESISFAAADVHGFGP